jgi:hypothetical protein
MSRRSSRRLNYGMALGCSSSRPQVRVCLTVHITSKAELPPETLNGLMGMPGGVYAEDQGGRVDEYSVVSDDPRMSKILGAEAATVEGKGIAVRLAGESVYTPWSPTGAVHPIMCLFRPLHSQPRAPYVLA